MSEFNFIADPKLKIASLDLSQMYIVIQTRKRLDNSDFIISNFYLLITTFPLYFISKQCVKITKITQLNWESITLNI
jgi:hypothetical protein